VGTTSGSGLALVDADPDASEADRDAAWAVAELDTRGDVVARGVDADDRAVAALGPRSSRVFT